jgi:hypothetical protein
MVRGRAPLAAFAALLLSWIAAARAQDAPATPPEPARQAGVEAGEPPGQPRALEVDFGVEGRLHFRDSQSLANPSPFPFPPEFLPPGETRGFQRTVDPGRHFEVSVLTLYADARWGELVAGHAKVDFIDLHDRNPTSSDHNVDVDELWLRLGRDPASVPGGFGLYAKVGKFAHFERQNDRHLESYGLVSTAFNRFEDAGLEVGADFGRHVYLRLSLTNGNPLFFRDPNALAGDNGTPDNDPSLHPHPVPRLQSGFPIFYDAEVEDFSTGGDPERGGGLGVRFGDPDGGRSVDLLIWAYRRKLQQTVHLNGTFYGGDLDLLRGPFDQTPLPITGDDKREVGGNLRVGLGGFTLFGQYVDQTLAGMKRTGLEGEAAWRFELPLVAAVDGRQLFPAIQPAVRYSRLDPHFTGGSPLYPAPSVRWPWVKIDYGIRLTVIAGIDLTAEYADNRLTRADGRVLSENELLVTLRFRK